MTHAGLAMIAVLAAACALTWWQKWLRASRALHEWSVRWAAAPELCALPGCGQKRDATCHISERYPDTEAEHHKLHFFLPARLVLAPNPMLREGIGAER